MTDSNQPNHNQPIRMIPKLNNDYVLFKAVEFGEVFGDMYLESDLDLPKNVQVDMLERCINDMIGVMMITDNQAINWVIDNKE